MPWKDLSPVQQRKAFIDEYLKQQDSVSELCRRFAVSRKTAYKWIQRFLAGCELVDRSRRPHSSPTATAAALEEAIVAARKDRPRWGPKKLRAFLLRAHPGIDLPSISTFAAIFKRNGLVIPRRRRRRTPPSTTGKRHAPQRDLVHRLQGRLPRRSAALLPADRHGRLQPLPALLRRSPQHSHRRCTAGAAHSLPDLWLARRHPVRTMARPSPPRPLRASPSSPPGGSSSVFDTSASSPASLSRAAGTSVCTSPSNSPLPVRLRALARPSSGPSIAFVSSTTSSAPTKHSGNAALPISTAVLPAGFQSLIGGAISTTPRVRTRPCPQVGPLALERSLYVRLRSSKASTARSSVATERLLARLLLPPPHRNSLC